MIELILSSNSWVSNPYEWSLRTHIVWVILGYACSYWMCVISSLCNTRAKGYKEGVKDSRLYRALKHFHSDFLLYAKTSNRICNIKVNIFLRIVLLLIPCTDKDGKVPIYSLIHQMLLQYGVIRFILSTMQNPSEVAEYSRIFTVVFMNTLFISMIGLVICSAINKRIDKKRKKEQVDTDDRREE